MYTLSTARLHLRKIVADDLDALVELDSDPEVMRYLTDGVPSPRALVEGTFLPRMMAFDPHAPAGFFAALVDGHFIGWFHLRPSVTGEQAQEIGYRLRRAAWGRGYATEGARALVRVGFEELEAPLVDACAHPENLASIAVMRRCGMTPLPSFVHPRIGREVVRYGLRRPTGTP